MRPEQLSLLDAVAATYAAADGPIDNSLLYKSVADRVGVDEDAFHHKVPVGEAGALHSPLARAARWAQQTLKVRGLLERVDRGVWSLTGSGRRELHAVKKHYSLVAFSTNLGIGLWGRCEDVFQGLETLIDLVVTSPPYPLQVKRRAYGNPTAEAYVDFLCAALEPVVARLAPGAHIALNISNDIFEPGSPARSLYKERLVLALHDRLGLHKMDELVWHVRNKPPGPVQWASIQRVQLSVAWEPVILLTCSPAFSKADNRRV